MLGAIIGVGAVIVMVAMGEGAKQSLSSQVEGLGTKPGHEDVVESPGFDPGRERGQTQGQETAAGGRTAAVSPTLAPRRPPAIPAAQAALSSRGEPAGLAGRVPSREGMGTLPGFPAQQSPGFGQLAPDRAI